MALQELQHKNPEESNIDFSEIIRIVSRGRWVILLSFLAVLSGTVYLNNTAIPVYKSSITLLSEEFRRESMAAFGGGDSWGYFVGDKPINNKQVILKSMLVSREVARFLMKSADAEKLSFLRNSKGVNYPVSRVARLLIQWIDVSFIPDSDIITFTSLGFGKNGAFEAAAIANAYGDVFFAKSFRELKSEIFEMKKFLRDQIETYRIDLEKSEQELKLFKEKEKLVSLGTETSQLIKFVGNFETQLNESRTTLITKRQRLKYLHEKIEANRIALPDEITKVTSPLLTSLRNELGRLEGLYANFLSQGIPDDHQQMLSTRSQINDIRQKLKDEATSIVFEDLLDPLSSSRTLVQNVLNLNIDIDSEEMRAEVLEQLMNQYDVQLQKLPGKSLELSRLERNVNLYTDLFLMLTKKYEEMRISEAGKLNNVSIIDRARPSRRPLKPNKKKNILIGILLGLGLGIGITLLIDFSDSTVKSSHEIERITGLSVIGAIPKIRSQNDGRGRRKQTDQESALKEMEARLITHFAPKSPIAEAYRTLRTNIQFFQPDKKLQTFMITSANPKEGKSTTIANIAIAMAQMSQRVVLLDTDFRRPILHKLFGLDRHTGLTSVLLGEKTLDEVVRPTEIDNLFLIPAGITPPNPSELLASDKMKNTLQELKDKFDLVFFDSPPVIAVTDAAILSSKVDGVLLVVHEGKTRRPDMNRAHELLAYVKANILGVVFNNIDVQRKYGYYYYYYYYHTYYTYGEDPEKKKSWWQRSKSGRS